MPTFINNLPDAEPEADFLRGTEAPTSTAVLWQTIDLEDVREGMTLRFRAVGQETIVCMARVEHFHPVDSDLVVDAVYPNARVRDVYSVYTEVAALRVAF